MTRLLLILLLVSSGFLSGCRSDSKEVYRLRASLWASETHSWYQAFQHFDLPSFLSSSYGVKL
ncbi:MAG: hypothetical protein AAFQ87_27425, partial [Bacteroidota bacterium]